MTALRTTVGSGRWRALIWVARSAVAFVLLGGAIWWSGTANFDGLSYCEVHHVECDGFGAERLAPFFLWPVTAFVTFFVCLAAALTGPVPIRQRVAWAATIGCSVFVANRNNLIWASVITTVAVWVIAWLTE
jgi:hypothetical protein